ncbi:M14 metallopeptidase family protein [Acidobacteriota bacterium]
MINKTPKASNIVFIYLVLLFSGSLCFSQITTPEEYLGYKPGADFHLATYEQLIGYFEKVANETNRIQLFDMGPTSMGKRMKYAVISSEENMANLKKYQDISKKLSLARGLTEQEAKSLAREGKVIVWIDSGLHASETSPPMQQFQLVYDLITKDEDPIQFIRDNVILLLIQANPDGMTLVADWYSGNVGTPFEMSRLPFLYHKYAGHDNNRDSFMANLVETQNMNKLVGREWFPELMYTQHEAAPFPARIWMPPNPEPVNPNIHPIVTRWKNLVGAAMGQGFDAANQPGALSRTAFDLWYPGYTDGPAVETHNIPTILTETANFGYATPQYYRINDFPEAYRDLTVGTFYPSPWRGGWWRLKDAIAYNLTASLSVLDAAAKYRYEFLYYKYKMGMDVIEKFSKEPPYGWIIPLNQRDPSTSLIMLNRFIGYGIEVYSANESFVYEGISYPEGSYIIPTNQAFGAYAKNILEKQEYPDLRNYGHLWQGLSRTVRWEGAPLAPYDGVGWTLHFQMGIEAFQMNSPLDIDKTLIQESIFVPGTLEGNGSHFALSSADNTSISAVFRILKAGGKIFRALSDFLIDGTKFPNGSFIIDARSLSRNTLTDIASKTGLIFRGGNVSVELKPIKIPRIALYKSWSASMDAGWISYIFDQHEIPFHALTDIEIRAGNLRDRFDVIILPDQSSSSIINGHRKGTMPAGYVGGITKDGAENLKVFVNNGGTLVCNKSSTGFAIDEFSLPIKNVLEGIRSDTFNCPGSILKVTFKTDFPLAFGLQEKGVGYFSRGQAFDLISDSDEGEQISSDKMTIRSIAQYPDENLLLSGWILGEELIQGKSAILEVLVEKGTIILFGFNIHNRAQSSRNFKLLFNAVLN